MRLVPWCGWAEWTSVGAALLSGGDDATVALRRVATWRARGTRLPLAVDVTALLVEARGHDAAYTNIAAGTCVSESALRSLYALALVRLVNGVTDPKQKGRFAAPVATLARQAGLPPLLVDVRHETAHNALPSLATLRTACDLALQWCASRYWEPQSHSCGAQVHRLASLVSELAAACALAMPTRHVSSAAVADGAMYTVDDEEEDEEMVVGSGIQDSAMKAKRRRRSAAMRAVAEAVPQTAAHQLVAAVLDGEDLSLLLAPQTAKQTLVAAAWRDALQMLARRYPLLPWLLLSGAVYRLSGSSGGRSVLRPHQLCDLAPVLVALATHDASCLTPRRLQSLRFGLAAADVDNPDVAEAAAALAAALRDAQSAAVLVNASGDDLDAAEAELRQLKRRKVANATPGAQTSDVGHWTRCSEWPPCGIGAPPGWVLTPDGRPLLDGDISMQMQETQQHFKEVTSQLFPPFVGSGAASTAAAGAVPTWTHDMAGGGDGGDRDVWDDNGAESDEPDE